jgi:hypothetical protein
MKVNVWIAAAMVALAGCGGSDTPTEHAEEAAPDRRESVFDPWVGTLDRAEGVQQTLDDQAAELRRRVEEAEQ